MFGYKEGKNKNYRMTKNTNLLNSMRQSKDAVREDLSDFRHTTARLLLYRFSAITDGQQHY